MNTSIEDASILDTLPLDSGVDPKSTPLIKLLPNQVLNRIEEFMGGDHFEEFSLTLREPLSSFFASIPLKFIPLLSTNRDAEWSLNDLEEFILYITNKKYSIEETYTQNGMDVKIEIVGDHAQILLKNSISINYDSIYESKLFFQTLRLIIDKGDLRKKIFEALEANNERILLEEFMLIAEKYMGESNKAKTLLYGDEIFIPLLKDIYESVRGTITDISGEPLKNPLRTIEIISVILNKILALGFGLEA